MKTIKTMIKDTKKKAFTLIELLIVVAIIGILAGVGVPMYNGYMASAKVKSAQSNHANSTSFIAATLTKCATGVEKVKMGSSEYYCSRAASSWDNYFVAYFNTINKNPYGGSSTCQYAATTSSSMCMGQTSITAYSNRIRVRTNVGTEAGANAYAPKSGYDEVTKE